MVVFEVLGPVTAWDDAGRELALKGPRHRAVLARLIVARRRVVPVADLVDDLWEDPPPGAVGALRTFVAALRRALEPGRPPRAPSRLLVTEGPGYALRTDAVDAWRFERAVAASAGKPPDSARALLEEALTWWRGPAYADFADQDWAVAERSRLAELRLHAVERHAETRLALGRAAEAVPDLGAHVAGHPWREDAWRLLALALYRTGRQRDALAVLRRARTLLADRLGLDPGPALRRLESDILRQAPELGPSLFPARLSGPAPEATQAISPTPEPTVDAGPETNHPSGPGQPVTPAPETTHPAGPGTETPRRSGPGSEAIRRPGHPTPEFPGPPPGAPPPRPGRLPAEPADVWARAAAAYDRAAPSAGRARLESTVLLMRDLAVTGDPGLREARQHRISAVEAAEELGDPELTARVIGLYDVPANWTRSDDPDQAAQLVAAARRTLAALPPDAPDAIRARLLATIALESRGPAAPPEPPPPTTAATKAPETAPAGPITQPGPPEPASPITQAATPEPVDPITQPGAPEPASHVPQPPEPVGHATAPTAPEAASPSAPVTPPPEDGGAAPRTEAYRSAREAVRLARRLDEPALLAFTLNGAYMQTFHRTGLAAERDAIGTELVTLSARHGLVTYEVLGHLIRLQSRSALADFPGADEHARAADDLARRHELPLAGVFTTWYRALRLDVAEQAGIGRVEAAYREAAALLDGAGMPGLERGLLPLALLCARLRRGLPLRFSRDGPPPRTSGFCVRPHPREGSTLTDSGGPATEGSAGTAEKTVGAGPTGEETVTGVDWGPYGPWVRPVLSIAAGRREEAARALRDAPDPPADLLQEALWCLIARAAVELGDRAAARRARDALAPAAGELAGAGSGMLTLGPVADQLAALEAR